MYLEHLKILAISLPISLLTLTLAYRSQFFKFGDALWTGSVSTRDLFGSFLFFLGTHLVIVPATGLMGLWIVSGEIERGVSQGWLNVYAMLLSSFILFFYTAKLADLPSRQTIWPKGQGIPIKLLFYGMMTFVISYPLVISLGQLIRLVMFGLFGIPEVDQVSVQALRETLDEPILWAVMTLCVVAIVPVMEEMLFRGYLQSWLRERMGPKQAIAITSVTFAGFHYSYQQGWSNLEFLFSLFILSTFLGLIFEKKRSLWAPIGLHMTFNALNVMVLMYG